MSRKRGKAGVSASEVEIIRETVSKLTGSDYLIDTHSRSDTEEAGWLIRIPGWDKKGVEYANAISGNGRGDAMIQSVVLGDLSDMVVWEYGKQEYRKYSELDVANFNDPKVREEFARRFPRLGAYLSKCEESVAQISSKINEDLHIKYEGGRDTTIGEYVAFWMIAKLKTEGMVLTEKLEKIQLGLAGMKEALALIDKAGPRWARTMQQALKTSENFGE